MSIDRSGRLQTPLESAMARDSSRLSRPVDLWSLLFGIAVGVLLTVAAL